MSRAIELQEEYVEKHGLVGLVISKSKRFKNKRYKLHKKAREVAKVFLRRKLIEGRVNDAVIELINEFGYVIQTKIE